MAPYSEVSDMLIGNLPLPAYIDQQKVLLAARDEIDAAIGFMYKTPIDISDSDTNPVVRPARLLLKQISIKLSSGRVILAAATGSEHTEVHAYGASLVREALGMLAQIVSGAFILEGAERVDLETEPNGPQIANVDPESAVEAFYDRMMPGRVPGVRVVRAPMFGGYL